jgi:hypothetical protein
MVNSGTPESKSTLKDPSAQSPLETAVKTKHMKSEQSMELLNYFDWLPDNANNKILDILCTFDEITVFKSSKPQKNLNNYMSEMVNKLTEDKCIYNEFMEAQHTLAIARKYSSNSLS